MSEEQLVKNALLQHSKQQFQEWVTNKNRNFLPTINKKAVIKPKQNMSLKQNRPFYYPKQSTNIELEVKIQQSKQIAQLLDKQLSNLFPFYKPKHRKSAFKKIDAGQMFSLLQQQRKALRNLDLKKSFR